MTSAAGGLWVGASRVIMSPRSPAEDAMARRDQAFGRRLRAAAVDHVRAALGEGAEVAEVGEVRDLAGDRLQDHPLFVQHRDRGEQRPRIGMSWRREYRSRPDPPRRSGPHT